MQEPAMKKNISKTLRKQLPILLQKHTASEIARMYGVSKELVRQLIVKDGGYKPGYRKWERVNEAAAEIRDKLVYKYFNSNQGRGTIAKLSRKYGLQYNTVHAIITKAKRNNKTKMGENC